MSIQEQLITFETAKLAKEKNIDKDNLMLFTYFYSKPNSKMYGIDKHSRTYPVKNTPRKLYEVGEYVVGNASNLFPAYSQSLLQKWLREKQVLVEPKPIDSWDSWCYVIYLQDAMSPFFRVSSVTWSEYKTYEEALEAGLQEALKLCNKL